MRDCGARCACVASPHAAFAECGRAYFGEPGDDVGCAVEPGRLCVSEAAVPQHARIHWVELDVVGVWDELRMDRDGAVVDGVVGAGRACGDGCGACVRGSVGVGHVHVTMLVGQQSMQQHVEGGLWDARFVGIVWDDALAGLERSVAGWSADDVAVEACVAHPATALRSVGGACRCDCGRAVRAVAHEPCGGLACELGVGIEVGGEHAVVGADHVPAVLLHERADGV